MKPAELARARHHRAVPATGQILRTDVTVGENYLTAGELTELS